jgi:uncharacterized protein YutE (UPF0331/DUF86 family)
MVNRNLVSAKLSQLASRVGRVRAHTRPSSDELAADADAFDLVAFNLMIAVQLCADIASHIIADAGWRSALTLAESFARLHEHGVLAEGSSRALARAVGLRNIVAHGYSAADPQLVHLAATAGLRDLDRFAIEVAVWIAAQK